MLELDTKIRIEKATIEAKNLCDLFSIEDLNALGSWALEAYKADKGSSEHWRNRMDTAINLAMQIVKPKSKPWPGCSNVAFPLVTIAALQFQARTYPVIVQGPDIVKYKYTGADPQGAKAQHAERVGRHMSYQLLEEDPTWEKHHDKLIYNIAIVGSAFKKSYFSYKDNRNASELVMAKDLVMDYYSKSVEECMRKTHIIPMFRNEIYERVKREMFRDILDEVWYQDPASVAPDPKQDQRSGLTPGIPDEDSPFTVCEMHCHLDLDDDGYAEPYILTFEESTGTVLRLVMRFDLEEDVERNGKDEIISIRATEYFTGYELLPSPDGGVYGLGFGALLGPINDSVSSLINQLIDAGTMANSAGGFLGRGAKLRGGVYTFSPLEWKRIDSSIDDVQKAVFPLPVREPSNVLFQLLGLLIEYSQRISGATDMLAGENPGQNTPAATSQTMVIEGSKIYSSIYRRIWRSMKEEFRKLYLLNALHTRTEGEMANQGDYKANPNFVTPSAPPFVLTDEQALQQAVALKQAAATTSGYNRELVERKYLKALRVDDIENVFPGEKVTGPLPNPKLQIEQLKNQLAEKELQAKQQQFMFQLVEERRLNSAKIAELQAKALKEASEAQGVADGHQIAYIEAAIGALKHHDESLRGHIELMLKGQEIENARQGAANGGGVPGMGKPSSDNAVPGPAGGPT